MKRILVIEDNYEVRDNLAEILSLSNYEIDTAENGLVGVEKAMENPPDLILCDVMMPELDGYGVLHILSKKPQMRDIPFVFLTAKGEKDDFRKGMNLGADDYVTKPFNHQELLEVIEMRLRKSERLKKTFDGTAIGLDSFFDEARGVEELEKLSEKRETRKFKKRDFIYQEGDLPRRLYFISEGRIKTTRTNENGKEYITHIYHPGEFMGYNALIQGIEYHESATAMEECEVAFIPKDDFMSLLHYNRDFSSRFIKMLTNNMEEKEEQLLNLAYNSIRKRVAKTLLKLNEEFKRDGLPGISILRDDFASLVGTAKESVIRTLTEFKTDGLIEIENGLIKVLDKEKLAQLPY